MPFPMVLFWLKSDQEISINSQINLILNKYAQKKVFKNEKKNI